MAARRRVPETDKPRRRPPTTPEALENELIGGAMDLAAQQIKEGSASSQVITHFLKLGSSRERLEQERLAHENELLAVKKEAIESQQRIEELYLNAIGAMRAYSGDRSEEEELIEELDDDDGV